jgi:uncharacterized membrane protein YdjX (TVP38/TMEM64 family)
MTLLAGLAFGPVRGAAHVWIAATIGAALAFLVARYGLRDLVESWVARNARLARIDEAVAREGWRIVMITRLDPLFRSTFRTTPTASRGLAFGPISAPPRFA